MYKSLQFDIYIERISLDAFYPFDSFGFAKSQCFIPCFLTSSAPCFLKLASCCRTRSVWPPFRSPTGGPAPLFPCPKDGCSFRSGRWAAPKLEEWTTSSVSSSWTARCRWSPSGGSVRFCIWKQQNFNGLLLRERKRRPKLNRRDG